MQANGDYRFISSRCAREKIRNTCSISSFTPKILNRNFNLLDIEAAKLEGLILSHGHPDHYGGMVGFVNQYRTAIFREKWQTPRADQSSISWGALDRIALTAQNVMPFCCGTLQALDGPFTTGRIERTSFEAITGGTKVTRDDHFTDAERRGELVLDEHGYEHGARFIVKGRGLVVNSSCGHTGIVNTVKTAMKVANVDKLHAVIGGFHLGMARPDYIKHTVDELEALAPDVVVPMHCTGAPFIEAMRQRMPDRIVASNLGSRFTFGV